MRRKEEGRGEDGGKEGWRKGGQRIAAVRLNHCFIQRLAIQKQDVLRRGEDELMQFNLNSFKGHHTQMQRTFSSYLVGIKSALEEFI